MTITVLKVWPDGSQELVEEEVPESWLQKETELHTGGNIDFN